MRRRRIYGVKVNRTRSCRPIRLIILFVHRDKEYGKIKQGICAVRGARYIGFADAIYPADTIYKYDMFRFAKRDLIGEFSPSAKIFLNIPQSGIYRAAGISYPKDISRLRSKHITRRPQTAQPPRFLSTYAYI